MSPYTRIFHNFWLKLFSLGLATLIWFAIHYGIRTDLELSQPQINHMVSKDYIRLPVATVTKPGDARVFKVTPSEIIVTAVGEEAILRQTASNSIQAYIDLTEFHSSLPTNEPVRAHTPPGVDIINLNPSAVKVEQISP